MANRTSVFAYSDLQLAVANLPCLDSRKNPVLLRAPELEHAALAEVLRQYSRLPRCIVSLLQSGRDAVEGWDEVADELEENIADERGARTEGSPHYTILCRQARAELGLELDDVHENAQTARFIDALKSGLDCGKRAYAAGVIFALESTAIPELAIVASAMNVYAEKTGRRPVVTFGLTESSAAGELKLDRFISMHISVFEVDHRDHLARALRQCVKGASEEEELRSGFHMVLEAMEQWWNSLAV